MYDNVRGGENCVEMRLDLCNHFDKDCFKQKHRRRLIADTELAWRRAGKLRLLVTLVASAAVNVMRWSGVRPPARLSVCLSVPT